MISDGCVLDVHGSVPQVILSGFGGGPPTDELGLSAFITAYNTIFVFVIASVIYGAVSVLYMCVRQMLQPWEVAPLPWPLN